MTKIQKGFTLLELMIGLSIGLLVVSAATAIFLSAQRSLGFQLGMGDVQQNSNFGLAMLTHDLRHANLNTPSNQKINNKMVGSGVTFAQENYPSALHASLENSAYSTQNAVDDATTGKSDQLVIQFVPQYQIAEASDVDPDDDTKKINERLLSNTDMYNCEGTRIEFVTAKANEETQAIRPTVVQRYFIQKLPDALQGSDGLDRYGLYCDAGHYNAGDSSITGLNNNAQLLMQNIDAFKVLLGVKNPGNNQLRYVTIDEYKNLMSSITAEKDYLQVISLQVSVVARSATNVGADASLNNKTITLPGATTAIAFDGDANLNKKYLRQLVTQVVGLRNTLGAS
ncbi:MAG: prepilin-type N-terminal cleavage/methylation domain-containing protein [Gammaproteobacteria bacterium]|jgi:prepilin-type N-terminal cleavage/methylation domain-containing protein|nr:prepilin-type N-terminal cleavage/methylation domain-containing protein [Gammaproteobacteria bacterium]